MEGAIRIQLITLDAVNWTPVVTPVPCSSLTFKNANSSMKIRSDPNDPATEDDIAQYGQFYVGGGGTGGSPRFAANRVLFYARNTQGTSSAVLTVITR